MSPVYRYLLALAAIALSACDLSIAGLASVAIDAGELGHHGPSADAGRTVDASSLTDADSPSLPSDDATANADAEDASAPEEDANSSADSGSDDGSPGINLCLGVICGGACLGAKDCSSCANAPLLCTITNTCMSSCDNCTNPAGTMPIQCFACDSTYMNPIGTCQPNDPSSYCLSGDYSEAYTDGGTGYPCACSTKDPTQGCPGATQVCVHSECLTCGEEEPHSTDSEPCGDGGTTCNADSQMCE